MKCFFVFMIGCENHPFRSSICPSSGGGKYLQYHENQRFSRLRCTSIRKACYFK